MKIQALSVLLVSLLLLSSTAAFAGEKDAAAVQQHIAVLVHEARALKAEGRHDAAEILWKRAHELKARLAERAHEGKGVPLTMEQAEKVLHGLEMGVEALKTLRREPELKVLAKVADEVRGRMRKARAAKRDVQRDERSEIQEARRQLEILRLAFHGLREGEKHEAMERMEHAIHALELGIEGRRDDEAMEIRRRAPNRGERIELLRLAAKLWKGFGHEDEARTIHELAEKTAASTRGRAARKAQKPQQREADLRKIGKRRLEAFKYAQAAFREVEKPRLVEQVERLIHAYEATLSGRDDDEVRSIWKKAPGTEQQAELMGYAARLYTEWGHEDRAKLLGALSKELLRKPIDRGPGVHEVRAERLERLQKQIQEIRRQAERLERELRALKR